MKKSLIALALGTVSLVAGCGTSPTLGVSTVETTSVAAQAVLTNLVLTGETVTVLKPSPMPGHLLPVELKSVFVGHSSEGRFDLVVKTINPGGDLYVPQLEQVQLNGCVVTGTALQDVVTSLNQAKVAFKPHDADSDTALEALGSHLML